MTAFNERSWGEQSVPAAQTRRNGMSLVLEHLIVGDEDKGKGGDDPLSKVTGDHTCQRGVID